MKKKKAQSDPHRKQADSCVAENEPKGKSKHDVDHLMEREDSFSLDHDRRAMYDASAYALLHELEVEWPSLSFDWLRTDYVPVSYPYEAHLVVGTQSASGRTNYLRVIRVENLHRTYERADDSDNEEEERSCKWVTDQLDEKSEDGDFDLDAEIGLKDPTTEYLGSDLETQDSINRIRSNPHNALVAAWAGNSVIVFECNELSNFAMNKVCSLHGGKHDGWALHWSPSVNYDQTLVAGNEDGSITVITDTARHDSAQKSKLQYAVQDVQLSATQPNIFISGGGGGNMSVFDMRETLKPKIAWNGSPLSKVDVNAIAWNSFASSEHLICTGDDEGVLRIWDLRSISTDDSNAVVKEIKGYHKSPISTIQWSSSSESVCIACSDTEASIYDFSIERDFQEEIAMARKTSELNERLDELHQNIPTEVLFEHGGLNYSKDVRLHPQIPGLFGVTHFDGYHIFRPINWKSLYD